jgi:transketolase
MSAAMGEANRVADFISRGAANKIPKLYGQALLAAARGDPRIVCLCADLPGPTETDLFKAEFPKRFFDAGIAEANMIGMAAGMARSGDIPFVHSFCVFVTRRCYDQIANQVAYPKLPVKIVGFLPGLTTALGVSHQAIDDIALMRALPNMTIIEPTGPGQMGAAVEAALSVPGPVYLRLKRPVGAFEGHRARPLPVGAGEILREGANGVVVACGLMVEQAMTAAEQLSAEGVELTVVALSTIKPLDENLIVSLGRKLGLVVTAENHSILGGLGSAMAETLLEAGVPVAFERVGVRDRFAEGGSTSYLQAKYGLDAAAIVSAYRRAAAKRGGTHPAK